MTTMTDTPVATLKAEMVTEFTFTPLKRTPRYRNSDTGEILAPYREDYEAKVGVKVGNSVKELTFRVHTHYMKSYNDSEGRFRTREDIEWLGIDERTHPFEELENAGVLIDYMDVLVQYQKDVEVARHRMILHKRFQKWEQIREQKRKYTESWMHTAEADLKADKNKKIQAALTHSKFTTKSLETYLKTGRASVCVEYKGVTAWIYMESGSYMFDGDSSFKFPEDWDGKNSHCHIFTIADGKTRRAKRLGTLYLKLVEEIDFEISSREARANQRKTEAQKREETRKTLETITGHKVLVIRIEKPKYSYGHNSGYEGTYTVYNYKIVTEQPKYSHSDVKGLNLHEKVETEYKDGIYKEVGKTYSVNGLNGLSPEQLKKIVDIAMEGKTALKEVVPTNE